MSFTIDSIRNIAIAGHGETGKTSLVEHILFNGGVISKAEPVETGRTVSDFTQEEIERKISIHTTLTHVNWKEMKINILDTPGSADFVGEVVAAFRCAESALVLVGARAGVQIETIKLWRQLNTRERPRMVFINMMERERADFHQTLEDLREKFEGQGCTSAGRDKDVGSPAKVTFVPMVIPIGNGTEFKGVVDLIDNKAYMVPGEGKRESPLDIPAEMQSMAEEYRTALIESAAEGNDQLLEKYFEEGTLSVDEIIQGLKEGIAGNKFVPVLCGSAILNSGIISLLNFISIAAPSPAGCKENAKNAKGEELKTAINPESVFSGFVFKTSIDQFSGRLSYVKVITGKLTSDMEIYNPREGKREKVSKLYSCQGKKLEDISQIMAGDIGILAKLNSVATNDTLCTQDNDIRYIPLRLPNPVHSVAVRAVNKKDEDKLNAFLQRAAEEDLTFQINYNSETKENVISGMGELHINMILDKIRDNQKIDIETKIPRVAYRETITTSANAEYTHKKQSGGHGQYGKVVIEIKPLPRGEHYKFENAIRGMAVSKGYIPGIEKGLHDAMEAGILAGYPVVDVATTLLDGKEHPVDSSEMSFRLAAKGAFKSAMENAKPVLLEPIVNLKVFVDDQYLGDVLSDLSSRRGRVLGQEPIGGGIQEISAQVPMAELLRYSIDLRSRTSGTASFEMEFDHYSPITGKIADAVIEASKAAKEHAT
ncbi:MAG: elongation factor G [Spirochaetota bacterium]